MDNYTIQHGDTLNGIATAKGVSLDAILKSNPAITDPNKIIAGGSLVIPKIANAAPAQPTIQTTTAQQATDAETTNRYHTVLGNKGLLPTPAPVPLDPSNARVLGPDTPAGGTGAAGAPAAPAPVPDMNSTIDSAYSSGTSDPTTIYNDLVTKGVPNASLQAVTDRISTLSQDPSKLAVSKTNKQLADLDAQYTTFKTQLEQLKTSTDAVDQAAIDSITATFDTRRNTLQSSYKNLSNLQQKAGYLTDSFRYTPTQAEGLVSDYEQKYVTDLATLDAQEKSALVAASKAKNSDDLDSLQKQMDLYDKINADKKTAIANLLTVATNNNKKIIADNQIAAKANALPSTASTIALAKAVAPSIRDAIDGMTDDEKTAYINEKATALKISTDVLNGAITGTLDAKEKQANTDKLNQDKLDLAKQKEADAKAKVAAAKGKGGGGKAPTASEKESAVYGQVNGLLEGNKSYNGTPYLDPNSFFTPQGFELLVQAALGKGVSRQKFIANYAGKFDSTNIDQYNLSAKEKKSILGIGV